MALINCPSCKQQISDKAQACPHCGHPLTTNSSHDKIICAECGNQYSKYQKLCPSCGYPNPVERLRIKNEKQKRKKRIKWSIILSIVLLIALFGTFIVIKAKSALYYENMEKVTYLMLDGAADSETAANLIVNVWHNAIFEEYDSETDSFTIKNGEFVDDFNDALDSLYSDEDFQYILEKIRTNQDDVVALMKQLNNPPKKYEEAYSVLKEYYDSYSKFTNMALCPSGSYNSFSEDFDNIDTETIDNFRKMELYLD